MEKTDEGLTCKGVAEYATATHAISELQTHLRTFSPFVVRRADLSVFPSPFCDLSTYLTDEVKSASVQVSVSQKGQPFSGDPLSACLVEMPLAEFISNYQANREHSEVSLYLSQCTIVSNEPDVPALLPQLEHLVGLPGLLDPTDTVRINLWMSTDASSTTVHYDANHNFLHVHKGRKQVTLIAPSFTRLLKAHPSWTTSANHASITLHELNELRQSKEGRENIIAVTLTEDSLVFIPEGWWHQVDSEAGTIAVNYWFKSPLYGLLHNRSLVTYVLRAALHQSVEHELEERLQAAQRAASQPRHKIQQVAAEGTLEWLRDVITGRNPQDLRQMAAKLLDFVRREPDRWAQLLVAEADPYTIELLTSAWETAQVQGLISDDFFAAMFDACGESADDVRVRLIQHKDLNRKQIAMQTLAGEHGIDLSR